MPACATNRCRDCSARSRRRRRYIPRRRRSWPGSPFWRRDRMPRSRSWTPPRPQEATQPRRHRRRRGPLCRGAARPDRGGTRARGCDRGRGGGGPGRRRGACGKDAAARASRWHDRHSGGGGRRGGRAGRTCPDAGSRQRNLVRVQSARRRAARACDRVGRSGPRIGAGRAHQREAGRAAESGASSQSGGRRARPAITTSTRSSCGWTRSPPQQNRPPARRYGSIR